MEILVKELVESSARLTFDTVDSIVQCMIVESDSNVSITHRQDTRFDLRGQMNVVDLRRNEWTSSHLISDRYFRLRLMIVDRDFA